MEPGTKVTCPKFDGGDGTVYVVISETETTVRIQDTDEGSLVVAIVPIAWVERVELP